MGSVFEMGSMVLAPMFLQAGMESNVSVIVLILNSNTFN